MFKYSFFKGIVDNLFKIISFKKTSIIISFISLSLLVLIQNSQQAKNNFSAESSMSSSALLQLSLSGTPANSLNCNDGLKVSVTTNSSFLAENPYSFDSGKTFGIVAFKIYTVTKTIQVGEIVVKDGYGNKIANTTTQVVDMISCSLPTVPISTYGSWTSSTSCNGTTQIVKYSCVGGNGQCVIAQPSGTTTLNSADCGYIAPIAPLTGTWTSSSSCTGTTEAISYSCIGGNGKCTGAQPSRVTTAKSPVCIDAPTGIWTSSASCNGTTQIISYMCTGGNGQCNGFQPTGLSVVNSADCGYLIPPTGTWTSLTSCNGTTQNTSFSCTGGNKLCSGSQPTSSPLLNSVACGYVVPPTGAWTSSTSCKGTTQITSYSCLGGNGQCSGSQPSDIQTVNSQACAVVPTGSWTSSTTCSGTTQTMSYSCTGGNNVCNGTQPSGSSKLNSAECGYVPPPTGTWKSTTSCSNTTQITSFSCTGGNGSCNGNQPSDISSVNSPACTVAPTGTWTSSTNCSDTTLITSYSCTGGNGQCSVAQPSVSPVMNSIACGYVVPPTGTWTSSTSCSGTTQSTSFSCTGGNGKCSGVQPIGSSIVNSTFCGYVAPSSQLVWEPLSTLITACVPYKQNCTMILASSPATPSGTCTDGNVIETYPSCDPAGTQDQNGNKCSYGTFVEKLYTCGNVTPKTGIWETSTNCSGTTQITSSLCTGGNGQCYGVQPTGSSIVNSTACGYVPLPTGSWSASRSCTGTTQFTSFSCTGGNGQCSGAQPNTQTLLNSTDCGYVFQAAWGTPQQVTPCVPSGQTCDLIMSLPSSKAIPTGTCTSNTNTNTSYNVSCSPKQLTDVYGNSCPNGTYTSILFTCSNSTTSLGTWTSSSKCNGTTQTVSFSCTGGNNYCLGSQPDDLTLVNSTACGYVAPTTTTSSSTVTTSSTGTQLVWGAPKYLLTSCVPNSLTCSMILSSSKAEPSGACTSGDYVNNYPSCDSKGLVDSNGKSCTNGTYSAKVYYCGNVTSPTGTWTPTTSCSGTTQITSYSCTDGNGQCSSTQPSGTSTINSTACGYVAPTTTTSSSTVTTSSTGTQLVWGAPKYLLTSCVPSSLTCSMILSSSKAEPSGACTSGDYVNNYPSCDPKGLIDSNGKSCTNGTYNAKVYYCQ